MTRSPLSALRRFWSEEDGNAIAPYALWVPLFVAIIVSTVEIGTITVRHTQLERALDQTVREVKIGVSPHTHDALKTAICAKTTVLPDCNANLQLEMIPLNMRSYVEPAAKADCVDIGQEATPQRSFRNGVGGQLMILRACYKFRPLTPASTLNASLPKDENGYTAIVSTSAFVYEPS
ncbi:TadE/TadG family type IV pilus assembly protein [Mameliella sediminis]|uniref:TadE/TadG family type IV pilus assembly protein n=1 Tax=Mameliella sediminis TaxID=2836866 RepID=UPI001C4912DC|nr:pilus assembly protein [Mameliella sediminis]MBY6117055.1 pilus assembly protein [Antarctobacter heliothermus]MBY6146807.1 pilus assembly protein [Mameliella alba]MBV7396311.1 pilus assembly protein [Mameliella sediminis]MBY6160721.1 pilus assembly protein [Mameliella alba]MBY6169191.1 pilus assembly protein [Mameliella alba]